MQKGALIVCILLLFTKNVLGNSNYIEYHKMINNAEQSIFIDSNFTKGIGWYRSAFEKYDFVFAADCLTAIQISLYANDEQSFINFVRKGFENGLILRHLKKVTFINKHSLYKKDSLLFERIYALDRSKYLSRIDTVVLKKMYDLFSKDQLTKNSLILPNGKFESINAHEKRYIPLIKSSIVELRKLVNENGFISDRLIGISQKDIMKELNLKCPDMEEYYWFNKNRNPCVIEIAQFKIDELALYSEMIIELLIHHPQRDNLFTDSFYLDQINKGNIHPKDVATIFDMTFLSKGLSNKSPTNVKYFGVGIPVNLKPNTDKLPDSFLNYYRNQFYIANIEIDRAKYLFMQRNKMYYIFGFMGYRS